MSKLVLIVAHPDLNKSQANQALLQTINSPEIEVRDLSRLYPKMQMDFEAELEALKGMTHLMFQFPLYWYSAPPIMKVWLDDVMAFFLKEQRIKGKSSLEGCQFALSVSAGTAQERFSPEGIGFTMDEILTPYYALARYMKMQRFDSFFLHGAGRQTLEALQADCLRYRQWMDNFLKTSIKFETP